eukprot:364125-Chlamydomonas_euryale.AAC.3
MAACALHARAMVACDVGTHAVAVCAHACECHGCMRPCARVPWLRARMHARACRHALCTRMPWLHAPMHVRAMAACARTRAWHCRGLDSLSHHRCQEGLPKGGRGRVSSPVSRLPNPKPTTLPSTFPPRLTRTGT